MARNVQGYMKEAKVKPDKPADLPLPTPKTETDQKELEKDTIFISHTKEEKEKVSLI